MSSRLPASLCCTVVTECPNCKSTDIRGPVDTTPHSEAKLFERSWFCRVCWWSQTIDLVDDSTPKPAARPSDRTPAARRVY